jgi:hypothetical protein
MVMTPITALEKPLFSGNAQCSKLNLPNAIRLILATLGQSHDFEMLDEKSKPISGVLKQSNTTL